MSFMSQVQPQRILVISGNSMSPTLESGDKVRVLPGNLLESGEVICFQLPGALKPVVHRLVHVEDSHIITRGDNRLVCDQPVPREAILGKAFHPDGTLLPKAPSNPPARIFFQWLVLQFRLWKLKLRLRRKKFSPQRR